ncbi:MAG: hypothetical protein LBO71_08370 [Prevotellaceae bacterium]|jgi:nucleoid DNA-binding protein|nr:hypothetical protein [Prevotellaceae bacterium]
MISNYLRKFVEDNHRVIIPNLGAFLRKNSANISFEASITFSPFLRFNDGLLENLVAEQESISKEAASEKILKFIQELQAAIAQKRPFYIKDLGAFYQDERKAVQFIYAETEQEAQRKFREIAAKMKGYDMFIPNEPEKTAEKTAAPVAEEVQEETVADKPASVAEPKKQQHSTPKEPAQQLETAANSLQEWMEKRKREAATASRVADMPAETDEPADEPAAKPNVQSAAEQASAEQAYHRQAQEPPHEDERPPYETSQDDDAKRRRQEAIARAIAEKKRKEQERQAEAQKERQKSGENSAPFVSGAWENEVMGKRKSSIGIWIFLGSTAFAFVAGMLALLYKPSTLNFVGWENRAKAVENVLPAKANNPQKSALAPAPVRQPNTYYIVAGVFNFEDNARAVSQKLYSAKKLKSEVVKMPNGKFAVSLSRYNSKNAALKDIDKYKKRHNSVWVAP